MSHVKTTDGYDVKVPSNGQVNLNTVLGALGTAGFAGINLRNLVGGLFNQGTFNGMDLNAILGMLIPLLTQMGCNCQPTCSEDHFVTRYELETENKLAAKDAEIALLKANTYNDQKALELYKYIDGELRGIREFICEQKVRNQGNADAIRELSRDIDAKVALEAERRCCADQRIVAYVNGTFAPKAVAEFTPDATATSVLTTYNPLCCECAK
ncbi:MAG: hypothetical protein IKB15_07520 [Alistipes sp.]|nr:hypothetical protein [Alistipes sp.]